MPVAAAGVFVQWLLAVPHHVVLSTTMFLEIKKITMNLWVPSNEIHGVLCSDNQMCCNVTAQDSEHNLKGDYCTIRILLALPRRKGPLEIVKVNLTKTAQYKLFRIFVQSVRRATVEQHTPLIVGPTYVSLNLMFSFGFGVYINSVRLIFNNIEECRLWNSSECFRLPLLLLLVGYFV